MDNSNTQVSRTGVTGSGAAEASGSERPFHPLAALIPGARRAAVGEAADTLRIRWMRRCDLDDVMALAGRPASGTVSPKALGEMLRRRNRVWLVAERGQKVVGFMVYEQTKTKLVILCLVTAPQQRRRHIAQVMIERLQRKLRMGGRRRILAYVHERNLPAQLFFRAMGFRAVFISPGHFDGDDAYLMRYTRTEIPS